MLAESQIIEFKVQSNESIMDIYTLLIQYVSYQNDLVNTGCFSLVISEL